MWVTFRISEWIRELRERIAQLVRYILAIDLAVYAAQFEKDMPGAGTGGYTVPTPAQATALRDAFARILKKDRAGATKVLNTSGLAYRVDLRYESSVGRWLVLLREYRPSGATKWKHGWGTYVVSEDSTSGVVVQVPHPRNDEETEAIGVDAFLHRDARALFIAGAHRYANPPKPKAEKPKAEDYEADVAHRIDSVFQAIHKQALVSIPSAKVVQFHGFDEDEARKDKTGLDLLQKGVKVIVSAGESAPSPAARARRVYDALKAKGWAACLYESSSCKVLGGTLNVQGDYMEDEDLRDNFVHIEISRSIRCPPPKGADFALRSPLTRTVIDTV